MKDVSVDEMLICEECKKEITNKLDAHCTEAEYKKLRMGDPSAVVFCGIDCMDIANSK